MPIQRQSPRQFQELIPRRQSCGGTKGIHVRFILKLSGTTFGLVSQNPSQNLLKGYANLFFGRFIVLMADENATGVSGCSTDSSVRLVKEIEKKYNVNLFDRQMLTFYIKEKIEVLPLSQLQYAIENKFINDDTLYFDNTVLTKEALENKWITPAKNTWLSAKLHI